MVRVLLEKGAGFVATFDLLNALAAALSYDNVDAALTLIASGAPVHGLQGEEDLDKCVPLHMAARRGLLPVVEKLLEDSFVDVDAEDDDGYTALTLAARWIRDATVD